MKIEGKKGIKDDSQVLACNNRYQYWRESRGKGGGMTNCIGHIEFGKPMGHQVVVTICEAQSLNSWTWTI